MRPSPVPLTRWTKVPDDPKWPPVVEPRELTKLPWIVTLGVALLGLCVVAAGWIAMEVRSLRAELISAVEGRQK